jgi:hypothetical protein
MQHRLEGRQQRGWIVVPCDRASSEGETLHEGMAGDVPRREDS